MTVNLPSGAQSVIIVTSYHLSDYTETKLIGLLDHLYV